MAKAPFQQHKSAKKYIVDVALKFCPAVWFGPAIIRAHDKSEYEKDRRYVREVYLEYRDRGRQKNPSFVGANGRGSIVDLRTYPAPVERTPSEAAEWDPWPSEKVAMVVDDDDDDPWRLPPVNEIF